MKPPLMLPALEPARKGAFECALLLILLMSGCFSLGARAGEAHYGIAMHGEPAMPADFAQLPYADRAAPKGGRFVQGVLGTFDSLNPFIVKGIAPPLTRGYVVESLMACGYDEAFTLYGLIASSVETDAQRSYVIFHLNPAARFSDGTPVTAEDVVFSWKLLRDKGRPNYRSYYAKVAKAKIIGERAVRFDLSGSNDRVGRRILAAIETAPLYTFRRRLQIAKSESAKRRSARMGAPCFCCTNRLCCVTTTRNCNGYCQAA